LKGKQILRAWEKGLPFFPLHIFRAGSHNHNNLTVQTVRQIKWIEKMCKCPDENFFALCFNILLISNFYLEFSKF
jgi:hypothetical protein